MATNISSPAPQPNGLPLNIGEEVCSIARFVLVSSIAMMILLCIKYSFIISPDIRMSDIMRNNHRETVIIFY